MQVGKGKQGDNIQTSEGKQMNPETSVKKLRKLVSFAHDQPTGMTWRTEYDHEVIFDEDKAINTLKIHPAKHEVKVWPKNGNSEKVHFKGSSDELDSLLRWLVNGPSNGWTLSEHVGIQRLVITNQRFKIRKVNKNDI